MGSWYKSRLKTLPMLVGQCRPNKQIKLSSLSGAISLMVFAEYATKHSELLSNCTYQTTWLCVAFWSTDTKQMVTLKYAFYLIKCFLFNNSNNKDYSFLFRNARLYYVLTVTAREKVTSGLGLCSRMTRATGIIDFTVHCPNGKNRNVLSQLRKHYFLLQSETKHPSFFFLFFSRHFP